MKKALEEGYSLIIFPEGTRGEPGSEQEMKPGVAMLLSLCSGVKYVPAYLYGMGKIMPKGDGLIVPFSSTLVYGKPTLPNSENIKEILTQIENDIKKLKTEAKNIEKNKIKIKP
jgi:1-acyl-sn-glycerol-3-phosphate acyltransferase